MAKYKKKDIPKIRAKGGELLAKGKRKKALEQFEILAELDPTDPKTFQRIGDIYAKEKNTDKAIAAYKRCVEQYMAAGFLVQAISICKVALSLDTARSDVEALLNELYAKKQGPAPATVRKAAAKPSAPMSPPAGQEKRTVPPPAAPQPAAQEPAAPPAPPADSLEAAFPSSDAGPAPPAVKPPPAEDAASLEDAFPSLGEDDVGAAIDAGVDEAVEDDIMVLDVGVEGEPAVEEPEEPEELLDIEVEAEPDAPEIEVATDIEVAPEAEDFVPEVDVDVEAAPESLPEIEVDTGADAFTPEVDGDVSAAAETTVDAADLEPDVEISFSEDAEDEEAGVEVDIARADEPAPAPEPEPEPAPVAAAPEPPPPEPEAAPAPPTLPPTPLFDELTPEEFAFVFKRIAARQVPAGEYVCQEGDPGDSIYILGDGEVEVTRTRDGETVSLAILRAGDFFGEFGFFSDSHRHADVKALEDVHLLEITRPGVFQIIKQFPDVQNKLDSFYKSRLIHNLLATSPMFKELSREDRERLAKVFTHESFAAGQVIIREGDEGDAMYLIRSGRVKVEAKNPMGAVVELAQLGPGDFFGEMSLLKGVIRTATVTALESVELMTLTKKALDAIIKKYPSVKSFLDDIMQRRADETTSKVSFLDMDDLDIEGLDQGSLI